MEDYRKGKRYSTITELAVVVTEVTLQVTIDITGPIVLA